MARLDIRPPVYNTGILIPEQFGAAGDGTTDDGAALNRMFAAGTNYKLTPGKTYYTTIQLVIPYTVQSFDMTGADITFPTTFTSTTSVMQVGDTSHNTLRAVFKGLSVAMSGTVPAWSANNANACVRFYNPKACLIEAVYLRGMTMGMQIVAEAAAGTLQATYNKIDIDFAQDNQIALDLRSNTAACAPNSNDIRIGEANISASKNVGQDGRAVRFSFGSGGYEIHNGNRVYINSTELNPGGAGDRTPVELLCGQQNNIQIGRAETYSTYIVKTAGSNTKDNRIAVMYFDGSALIDDSSTGGVNILAADTKPSGLERVLGWSSGPLVDRLYHYNATDVSLRSLMIVSSAPADAYTTLMNTSASSAATGLVMRRDWIEVGTSRGIGVYVDTTTHKTFRVWREAVGSAGGRVFVNCYDADGTVISDGTGLLGISTYASWGIGFRTGSDAATSAVFRVTSAVKKIRVLITGGTAAAKIKSFGIQPVGGDAEAPLTIWGEPKQAGHDEYMASSTVPSTFGRYALGDEVLNNGVTTAISTGLRGWKCTTAGAFAPAWAASTAYVAGQLVLNDTNKIYWCKTAGTSAGSGGPTGSTEATDITDNTVTWRYLCPLAVFTTMYGNDVPTQSGTVSTTDATVTTILTIPITTNSQTTLQVTVAARRTGGSGGAAADGASYIRGVSVKDNAGTPTIIGSSAMMTDQESQAAWDVTFDISTTNLRVRVTGAANNNIDWSATARILSVT